MGDGVYPVPVHDGRTYAYSPRALAHFYLLKSAVRALLVHVFAAVISHIDERRFGFHQGIQVLKNGLDRLTL
jgi:hypothetical protein